MKVTIVTEGLRNTGYGHLTRCLAIYQAFQENNILPLLIANCDDEGKKYLGSINLLQMDWLSNKEQFLNKIRGNDIAVIDSYLAPRDFYKDLKENVNVAAYIDDYVRIDYPEGLLINGCAGAEKLPYKKDNIHAYLLGVEYIPLRKEFWDTPKVNQNVNIDRLLITFGGQDIRDLTFPTLDTLLHAFPRLQYHVVLATRHKKLDLDHYNKFNVIFYTSLHAQEMIDLMTNSDLAISAAGQTTYELARIGVPTIAIGVAKNQMYNIKGWINLGFINSEIWFDDKDLYDKIINEVGLILKKENRSDSIYCDGQGARRIVRKLLGMEVHAE